MTAIAALDASHLDAADNADSLTRRLARLPRLAQAPRAQLAGLALAALLVAPPCAAVAQAACQLDNAQNEGAGETATANAGMPANCPLHEAHMKAARMESDTTAAAHHHAVDARGDVAMGFSQQATVHHFRLADDGGAIEVTVRDLADTTTLATVRQHLATIATAFAGGDFSTPTAVHARVPPGVEGMKAAGGAVRYRYEELPAGGRVTISADGAQAVAAVHDFLRFQIADHATGDPVPST